MTWRQGFCRTTRNCSSSAAPKYLGWKVVPQAAAPMHKVYSGGDFEILCFAKSLSCYSQLYVCWKFWGRGVLFGAQQCELLVGFVWASVGVQEESGSYRARLLGNIKSWTGIQTLKKIFGRPGQRYAQSYWRHDSAGVMDVDLILVQHWGSTRIHTFIWHTWDVHVNYACRIVENEPGPYLGDVCRP